MLIVPIKQMQILYLFSCICQPMLSSVVGMLIFLYTFLLFHHYAMAESTVCQIMGDPKYPLLYKNGDLTIGGLFAIHSKETLSSFEFKEKPQVLSCSRCVLLEIS